MPALNPCLPDVPACRMSLPAGAFLSARPGFTPGLSRRSGWTLPPRPQLAYRSVACGSAVSPGPPSGLCPYPDRPTETADAPPRWPFMAARPNRRSNDSLSIQRQFPGIPALRHNPTVAAGRQKSKQENNRSAGFCQRADHHCATRARICPARSLAGRARRAPAAASSPATGPAVEPSTSRTERPSGRSSRGSSGTMRR